MRLARILTAASVGCLVVLSLSGGSNVSGGEPPGILPHYHGFDVARRHWAGWRDRGSVHHFGHSRRRATTFGVWGGVPSASFFSYGSVPYGYDYPAGVFVLPPVFVPPEWHFGPQALDRFLGIDRNAVNPLVLPPALLQQQLVAPLPNVGGLVGAGQGGAGQVGAGQGGAGQGGAGQGGAGQGGAGQVGAGQVGGGELERPAVRESNQAARERAERFVQFGDALFGQQRYHEALQRYKAAAEAAPDLAEPYYRQAHALIATNRMDLAATSVKRALALDADVTRNGFQLDDLYGDAQIAKAAHLDGLAQAALNQPADPGPLLLLGLFLYYDGQADRSRQFFDRAAVLLGENSAYARRYLDQLAAEQQVGIEL